MKTEQKRIEEVKLINEITIELLDIMNHKEEITLSDLVGCIMGQLNVFKQKLRELDKV